MLQRFTVGLAVAATLSSAQLLTDIGDLLGSLGPAPDDDPRFTTFTPAGPGDVRSPCPGLNTLANHGFIHHDGKNLTLPHLLQGLAAGLNMGADFTVAIGGAGLLAAPYPLAGAFDLDQLDEHNFPIEHDGSLSRQDAYYGNDHSFYNPNWQQVLSFFDGMEETSIETASHAKFSRVNDSLTQNPTVVYGLREFILSYGETALYLQTMSSPSANGTAKVSYVRSLFEEERLPYHLGWRVSQEPITLLSLGELITQLYLAGPEPLPEGAEVTADSYENIFELIAGGSNALNNLTQGLAHAVGL